MFLGEFSHTLDTKGRLTVPSKFRDQLEAGLVVTRSPMDRCLLLFPMSEWEKIATKVSALPLADPRSAQLRRAFFSAAEDLVPDKQGRILMSQRLRDWAQIESEVIVAGVNTFVEIWRPNLWDEKVLQPLDSGEFDQEFFAALNI
ncbi:MAG TPA: division/cell wall cluster transcriptional repressor MraZ [Caldilineaceae bacterium]|nr:division/cell wall cluster transcriptional repressor MraZ [Caldilineaceae bacterium]